MIRRGFDSIGITMSLAVERTEIEVFMCSFVALRATVNQSLSIAFSDASIPPLYFWCSFFFCSQRIELDPTE